MTNPLVLRQECASCTSWVVIVEAVYHYHLENMLLFWIKIAHNLARATFHRSRPCRSRRWTGRRCLQVVSQGPMAEAPYFADEELFVRALRVRRQKIEQVPRVCLRATSYLYGALERLPPRKEGLVQLSASTPLHDDNCAYERVHLVLGHGSISCGHSEGCWLLQRDTCSS